MCNSAHVANVSIAQIIGKVPSIFRIFLIIFIHFVKRLKLNLLKFFAFGYITVRKENPAVGTAITVTPHPPKLMGGKHLNRVNVCFSIPTSSVGIPQYFSAEYYFM